MGSPSRNSKIFHILWLDKYGIRHSAQYAREDNAIRRYLLEKMTNRHVKVRIRKSWALKNPERETFIKDKCRDKL